MSDLSLSSANAHRQCKQLLNISLKEGDYWYAVSNEWFQKLKFYAYLDKDYGNSDENEDYYQMFTEREIPPPLNDSDLKRSADKTCDLNKELIENLDFVWIHSKLYNQFVSWFGVESGSLKFEREVIDLGNEVMSELRIEMHPIFVYCVECGDDGEADESTSRLYSIPRHKNVNDLIERTSTKKEDDFSDFLSLDDDDNVRVWKWEIVEKAPSADEDSQQNEGGNDAEDEGSSQWKPFGDMEDVDVIAPPNEELPEYEDVDEAEQEEESPQFEWRLLSDKECNVNFGEWALNESNIKYMIERKDDNGNWKRKYDEEAWRHSLFLNKKVDIFDKNMGKWYTGSVAAIGANGEVLCSYDGYSSNFDEWFDVMSEHIAPLNTHTAPDPVWGNESWGNASWGIGFGNEDTHKPPDENGCVGLRNLGNTCFMNSTIQCLCHCPLFVDYFLQNKHLNEINVENPLGWKGEVASVWSGLLTKYWSNSYSVLSPNELKSKIGEIQPRFSGYQQHDSSELLQFLLDGLHEDLNRVKEKPYTQKVESNDANNDKIISQKAWEVHKMRNDSIVVDLIQGQLKSRVECPDCQRISVTFDPFMFLSVPIPTEKQYVVKIVTVIHLDLHILPKKYAVKLEAISSIGDLKDGLEEITKIPKNRQCVVDVYNHHIYQIYENYASIDQITDNEHTVVYEISDDDKLKGLFEDVTDDCKFKLVPIYHQILKESNYMNSRHVTSEDVGLPLLIKLPCGQDLDSSLVAAYVTKMIEPYIQNLDKWNPSQQIKYESHHMTSSLDSDDDNDGPKLFDDESGDENAKCEPGSVNVKITETSSNQQSDSDLSEYRDSPFTLLVLDKYGRNYGDDCVLSKANGSTMKIPDNKWEGRTIGVMWKHGACFNHNVFLSPLHHSSVDLDASPKNKKFDERASVEKTIHLSNCIDEFVKEETLSKNDAWYCSNCKDHKCAKKKLDLYSLPSICIIHLKRFTQNGDYRQKNDSRIVYPINGLDLSQWITHSKEEQLYDLFAVSIHSGGLGGGHYIAYAKNLDNQKWFEFDDSCVSSLKEEAALTDSAYVLFYSKRGVQSSAIEKELKKLSLD